MVYDALINPQDPPDDEWDLETFYIELKKLILWDVKRRVSDKGLKLVNFSSYSEVIDRSFNFEDPENPIAKACRREYDKGRSLKAVYEQIKLDMVFS
jgi:hypothetical protein